MKVYSIAAAPTCAGLYYLRNKKTGEIYVGQTTGLRRRLSEWKNALSSGFGHTNNALFEAFSRSPDLDEWVFIIKKEMPGADTQTLLAEEAKEISMLQNTLGDKCLNIAPSNLVVANALDRVAIIMPDGSMVGQAKAAELLGRNVDTIKEKIKWLKNQGVMSVDLHELLLDRRKILENKK